MEKIKFPDWTPAVIVELAQSGRRSPLLLRFATHPDMERVWRELNKHEPERKHEARLLKFVEDTFLASMIPRKTKREEAAKYQRVANAARELAEAISSTAIDHDLYRYFGDEQEQASLRFVAVTDLAKWIEQEADRLAHNPDLWWIKHRGYPRPALNPRSKGARKIYFIRALSTHMTKAYGSPMYRTLATIARVALEDYEIDEYTVRSALRNWP